MQRRSLSPFYDSFEWKYSVVKDGKYFKKDSRVWLHKSSKKSAEMPRKKSTLLARALSNYRQRILMMKRLNLKKNLSAALECGGGPGKRGVRTARNHLWFLRSGENDGYCNWAFEGENPNLNPLPDQRGSEARPLHDDPEAGRGSDPMVTDSNCVSVPLRISPTTADLSREDTAADEQRELFCTFRFRGSASPPEGLQSMEAEKGVGRCFLTRSPAMASGQLSDVDCEMKDKNEAQLPARPDGAFSDPS